MHQDPGQQSKPTTQHGLPTYCFACCSLSAAGEGERVSLGKNTVKARNSVESWLGQVESAMVSSLRRLAKQGMATYVEEQREDWVLQQPAQLVIAVSQVYWCAAVEEALRSDTAVQKLAEAHEVRAGAVAGWCRLAVRPASHSE
jgi:dynein heavy chain